MKPIVMTRRITLAIVAIAAASTLVGASLLSNYLVPSTVTITSAPGITVFLADLSTNSCTSTVVTSFALGDVQISQSKDFASVCIRNTGGSLTAYIISDQLLSGGSPNSLQTQSPLPSGVSLSWNFPSVAAGTNNAGCASSLHHCMGLSPGQQTPPTTLTFAVDTSASTGTLTFTIQFDAFSTING